MALIIADDRAGLGGQIVVAQGDNLWVAAGTSVVSEDVAAIYVTSPEPHVIRIDGHVDGQTGGLVCGVVGQMGASHIVVGRGGAVVADQAEAFSFGISLQSVGSTLENYGSISGYFGVTLPGSTNVGATFQSTIINWGNITGASGAVRHNASLTDRSSVLIVNHGEMISQRFAIVMAPVEGVVRVFNLGTLKGDVVLGQGSDVFDGSRGQHLGPTGGGIAEIDGGTGDDRFYLGRSAESVVGGSGYDEVDYSRSAGVHAALDGTAGTGMALGDLFFDVEGLRGSAQGNDVLRGNNSGNTLYGLGGRDQLVGLGGNDELLGGAGRDTLTGGAGNDSFFFTKPSDGGDVIGDFGQTTGNDDELVLLAPAFGIRTTTAIRAATADEFWAVRGHHRAHDASDRFIFNSQDATLWFDPDGTGRRAAVLIADLQAGAVLTAADIVLLLL